MDVFIQAGITVFTSAITRGCNHDIVMAIYQSTCASVGHAERCTQTTGACYKSGTVPTRSTSAFHRCIYMPSGAKHLPQQKKSCFVACK